MVKFAKTRQNGFNINNFFKIVSGTKITINILFYFVKMKTLLKFKSENDFYVCKICCLNVQPRKKLQTKTK